MSGQEKNDIGNIMCCTHDVGHIKCTAYREWIIVLLGGGGLWIKMEILN